MLLFLGHVLPYTFSWPCTAIGDSDEATVKRHWQRGSGGCDKGEDDGGGVEANGDGGGVVWRQGGGHSKAAATAMRERRGDGYEGAAMGQWRL